MNRIIVALASLLIVTTPLAGCLDEATLEEIIDDIVGCMDTQAKNYDENATTELVGNCIYAASMDAFFDAMNQEIDIQSMLNQSTTAGYSMSMTMPMGDELGDMGDAMMLVEETVMVNMSANAAHVSMVMSVPMMFSSTTTMIQVGEVVNVHHKLDGMMVTEMGAETIDDKYQTRDMNPNVMEWVIPMLADSMASDMGNGSEDPKDDLTDEGWDMESATISVSFDSSTNAQTMALSTTNETGSIMNLSIKIDESSNLMSYSMVMTNETGSASHVNYAIMWDEAVVITVDQTLPKTAIPVHWDGLPDSNNNEDDDWDNEDDPSVDDIMMMIDQDEDSLISWDEFEHFIINEDGGWEDDDDKSETQDHFNYSDDNQDGYLDIDELSNWIESMDDNEEDMWMCDNGEEIPESWVNDGEEDCSDGSDEYDNDNSDDGGHDHDNDDDFEEEDEEPRDLSLTVANNQTFEAPLSDFSIQFLTCNSDIRSECNVEESASLNSLTGQMGNSTYVYVDTDADGMISAGDTLEITNMGPYFDFDLYDSWSDSYVSDSGVNGPSIPGFGGILATISMLAAAFLLPRRDD
ncbi:PGF-CTERM sorting domain-containing protein [Euryarchaeota archaeon]|nr:PGF-CTERM sorting domain-containing protein [Euryarchaeota archaeon]